MDAREKLLITSTRLFAQKGFAAVSIRELAQAAETNSALISYYFGGKEGLYAAVMENQFAQVELMIANVAKRRLPPQEKIAAFTAGVWKIHSQNPYIIRFLFSELANPTAAFTRIQQMVQNNYHFLYQAINEGIACGQFRADLNPAHAVLALAGMLNFYFLSYPLRENVLPETAPNEQYFADALTIYLNGVAKHEDE